MSHGTYDIPCTWHTLQYLFILTCLYLHYIQYGEALVLETSTGGSDTDTLRLQAGTIVDFLDWALPETPRPTPFNGTFRVSDFVVAPFSVVLFRFAEEAQQQRWT